MLLIEDEPGLAQLVTDHLIAELPGLRIAIVSEGVECRRALQAGDFDVVITDYELGWTNGLAVLQEIKARDPDCPVIMFTGSGSEELAVEAIKAGLDDYLLKPKHLRRLPAAVRSVLQHRDERRAVTVAEADLRSAVDRAQALLNGTIQAMARMTEIRDPYTAGHQRRVAELACAIAGALGLPEPQTEHLRIASLLHDIGKIIVPAEILTRPTPLTAAELAIVQAHAQAGHDILRPIEFPGRTVQAVAQHHERLDGSGYPRGLAGDAIILEARILAVADMVDAMTSHRPYRPAFPVDAVLEFLVRDRGLDGDAVDACRQLFMVRGFRFTREALEGAEGIARDPRA